MARSYDNTYSRIVAWLKVLLPLAALVILSTLFLVSNRLEPDSSLPYSNSRVGEILRDQRIGKPDFSGVTRDGATIALAAAAAKPDPANPARMSAETLQGRIETPDGGRLDLAAGTGVIDNGAATVDLEGGVTVETSTGYTAETERLRSSLDATSVEAPGQVQAVGPPGRLTAGAMTLGKAEDGRYLLVFKNGVQLVYTPATP